MPAIDLLEQVMESPDVGLTPGFWAECRKSIPRVTDRDQLMASLGTTNPVHVVRWMRVALRTFASSSTLHHEAFDRVWSWVEGGYHEAYRAMDRRERYLFEVRAEGMRMVWAIQPVLLLPQPEVIGVDACPGPYRPRTTELVYGASVGRPAHGA